METELLPKEERQAKLLVVDDDKNFLFGVTRMLAKANFDVISASDGMNGILRAQKEQPDLIILDVNMPVMNGFQVKKALESNPETKHIPVVFLTALTDRVSTLGGLNNADDYIYKPFDADILVTRLKGILRRSSAGYSKAIIDSKNPMFSSDQFQQWGQAVEVHDYGTAGHTLRVAGWFIVLGRWKGIKGDELDNYRRGAMLHDIGKLGIPEKILNKVAALDEEEWAIIRQHPRYGYDMLSAIGLPESIKEIPLNHHERWDGNGYPDHKKGNEIPLSARLFSVIDVFDALVSKRPYKTGFSVQQSLDKIQEQSGSYFDPEVVDFFITNYYSLKKEVEDDSR